MTQQLREPAFFPKDRVPWQPHTKRKIKRAGDHLAEHCPSNQKALGPISRTTQERDTKIEALRKSTCPVFAKPYIRLQQQKWNERKQFHEKETQTTLLIKSSKKNLKGMGKLYLLVCIFIALEGGKKARKVRGAAPGRRAQWAPWQHAGRRTRTAGDSRQTLSERQAAQAVTSSRV